MDGSWKLGIEDELGYGREGAHVWVVSWVGTIRLVESKIFEDLGKVSKWACCSARLGLLECFEEDFMVND